MVSLYPPMVVYKAENLWSGWTEQGPPGSVYTTTTSGWFNKEKFLVWFRDCFLKQTQHIPGPKVLLGDNVALHTNDKVFRLGMANNCHFAFFPANATHLLQPLDVGVFGPLKQKWREIVAATLKDVNQRNIPKEMFPRMVNKLLRDYKNFGQNLNASFRACGLVPFCPQKALDQLPQNKKRKRSRDVDVSQAVMDTHTALIQSWKEAKNHHKKEGSKVIRLEYLSLLPAGKNSVDICV